MLIEIEYEGCDGVIRKKELSVLGVVTNVKAGIEPADYDVLRPNEIDERLERINNLVKR